MRRAAHQSVSAVEEARGEAAGRAPQATPLPGLAAEPCALVHGMAGDARARWPGAGAFRDGPPTQRAAGPFLSRRAGTG